MLTANQAASLALMYHRIGSPLTRSIVRGQYVLPAAFRAQITLLLRRGYRPLPLARVLAQPEHATGCVSITFDDGYASMRRLAYRSIAGGMLLECQAEGTADNKPVESAIGKGGEEATIKGIVLKNGQPIGVIEMMFSHIDNNLSGVKFPEENFVFTGSFERMVAPFLEAARG